MSYIPDNYDKWLQHDAEQERQLQMLPKCSECGEHIQQERAVYYDGKWCCKECESDFWRRIREDFLENTSK
jgi:formylmethanofuran dehydrogenase subunit E